jgi:hypothetical protein
VLWPGLTVIVLGGFAVTVLTNLPTHRWRYTVTSTTVRLSTATAAVVQPGSRYWLYFGRTIAATTADTPDACQWFPGQPDPAAPLGPVKTLQADPGLHATVGTVLAKADTTGAQQTLATAQQVVTQAEALLAADQQAALELASAPVPLLPEPVPAGTAPATVVVPAAPVQPTLPPSFAANARIGADQERLAAAQRQQAAAARTVQDGTITAPVDGIVEQVGTAVGGTASCHTPVLMMRSDALELHTGVPEELLAFLRVGQQVDINVPGARLSLTTKLTTLPLHTAGTVQPTTGTATALGPILQAMATPVYPLDLPLPPTSSDALLPGMGATTIFLVTRGDALAVPVEAVHYNAARTAGTVQRCSAESEGCTKSGPTTVDVRVGLIGDTLTEITSGLSAGDIVVTPRRPPSD